MFLFSDLRKLDREESDSVSGVLKRTSSLRKYQDMRRCAEPRNKTSVNTCNVVNRESSSMVQKLDQKDSDSVSGVIKRTSSLRKYPEMRRCAEFRRKSVVNTCAYLANRQMSRSVSIDNLTKVSRDSDKETSFVMLTTSNKLCEAQPLKSKRKVDFEDNWEISQECHPACCDEIANVGDDLVDEETVENIDDDLNKPNDFTDKTTNDGECLQSHPFFDSTQKHEISHNSDSFYITFALPLKASLVDSQTSAKRDDTCFTTNSQRLILNVGGMLFETLETTLAVHPNTLLGDPDRRVKYLNRHTGEFVFHRKFESFDAILFFYQSNGILSKPQTVDQLTFESELEFFEIPRKNSVSISRKRRELIRPKRFLPHRRTPQRILHHLFNRPFTSPSSSVVAILTILVTLLLTIEFCVSTLPRYRLIGPKDPVSLLPKEGQLKVLIGIEVFCMVFFNIDFLIRLLVSPRRIKFLMSHLSIIDMITLLCFYMSLVLSSLNIDHKIKRYVYLLRQFRILQMFRLARYSSGFRSLLLTISNSLVHLGSFILVIPVMSMFFASMTFFVEDGHYNWHEHCQNKCRPFHANLSDWFWYSVITITTVGYGDVYPKTILGKMIGTTCAIFGVILFCLLTPIIFRHFVEQYYIKNLMSGNLKEERRKLAEKVKEMYYEQYNDFYD